MTIDQEALPASSSQDAPELLNRLDEIGGSAISSRASPRIVDISCVASARLAEREITLDAHPSKYLLGNLGYDPTTAARP